MNFVRLRPERGPLRCVNREFSASFPAQSRLTKVNRNAGGTTKSQKQSPIRLCPPVHVL